MEDARFYWAVVYRLLSFHCCVLWVVFYYVLPQGTRFVFSRHELCHTGYKHHNINFMSFLKIQFIVVINRPFIVGQYVTRIVFSSSDK
jgi:hypothetical protein